MKTNERNGVRVRAADRIVSVIIAVMHTVDFIILNFLLRGAPVWAEKIRHALSQYVRDHGMPPEITGYSHLQGILKPYLVLPPEEHAPFTVSEYRGWKDTITLDLRAKTRDTVIVISVPAYRVNSLEKTALRPLTRVKEG